MAKNRQVQQQDNDVTAVILRFKGSDASLQKGFESIAAAIAGISPTNGRSYLITGPQAKELPAPLIVDPNDDCSELIEDPAQTVAAPPTRPQRPVKSPELLEIDCSSGEVPLATLLGKYTGDEISKRYLLI